MGKVCEVCFPRTPTSEGVNSFILLSLLGVFPTNLGLSFFWGQGRGVPIPAPAETAASLPGSVAAAGVPSKDLTHNCGSEILSNRTAGQGQVSLHLLLDQLENLHGDSCPRGPERQWSGLPGRRSAQSQPGEREGQAQAEVGLRLPEICTNAPDPGQVLMLCPLNAS